MSFTLNLEADCKVQLREIISALKSAGAGDFVEEEFGLSGNFSVSNMHFGLFDRNNSYWTENGMRSCVITEGVSEPLDWDICARISFKYVRDRYAECSKELHQFLHRLAELTSGNFLLSFQYETIYVVNDEDGLQFVEEF